MKLLMITIHTALNFNLVFILVTTHVGIVHGWPEGTFGLPMPKTGCPVGAVVDWETGSRAQRTEDGSHASDSVHLAGIESAPTDHIVQLFCMKMTFPKESDYGWMPGQYCILKKGDCPENFHEGFIYWDDAAPWFGGRDTRQSSKGVLPDGSYNKNTKVEYCCRKDGLTARPIQLPSSAPFYLYKFGDACQEVENTYVNEEWVYWSDESSHNLNAVGGLYPRVIRSKFSPVFTKLFYCYYQPKPPNVLMKTVLNVVYAVVGLIGLFIFVIAVVCISVHIYHCCSRHRRKQSDAVGDACSRPSAASTIVDCQYVTLETTDGTAMPTAPPHTQAANCESVELQPFACPGNGHSDVKPPTYDEVMGYR